MTVRTTRVGPEYLSPQSNAEIDLRYRSESLCSNERHPRVFRASGRIYS